MEFSTITGIRVIGEKMSMDSIIKMTTTMASQIIIVLME